MLQEISVDIHRPQLFHKCHRGGAPVGESSLMVTPLLINWG